MWQTAGSSVTGMALPHREMASRALVVVASPVALWDGTQSAHSSIAPQQDAGEDVGASQLAGANAAHSRDVVRMPAVTRVAQNRLASGIRGRLPAALAMRAIGCPVGARLGDVDADGPIVKHVTIQLGDCGLGGGRVGHLYEAEAFALAGGAVNRDRGFGHIAIRAEEREEILIGRRERQASNVDAGGHGGPFRVGVWRSRPWGDGIKTTQSRSVCAPLHGFGG